MTGLPAIQATPNLIIPAFEPWEDLAACKGADPSLFYPETGGGSAAATRHAKAICRACPVRRECLDFALRHSVSEYGAGRYGTWAGLGERERRPLNRAARRAAA